MRLTHQRTGQSEALLLAAGKLSRHAVLVAVQLHLRERRADLFFNIGATEALFTDAQREGNIFEDRHVRPDGVALEYHADGPAIGGHESPVFCREDFLVVDDNFPAVRLFQSRDAAQSSSFAATRRA